MKLHARLFVLPLAALLTACASGIPQRTEGTFSEVDRYLQYDQGSVGSINYFGRFDGWRPLERERLLVWDGLDNAYLISVAPPCRDLEFTNMIGFTTRVRGTISSGIDAVQTSSERCRITEIRRIDYRKMKQDEKKEE
jgi:hypothetical protein